MGGHDAFSRHMFSLVGLGSEANRGMMNINHSKMLAYAGLLPVQVALPMLFVA